MEKYGFVYIWRDRKHNRYYVGSHYGHEDDGYICSSNWMRDAYRRRPSDFKRRIIKKYYNIRRQDLFLEEDIYLKMIKINELGKRYYNLQNKTCLRDYHPTKESTKEKLRKAHEEQFSDPEKRKKHSDAVKLAMNKPEVKEKVSKAGKGRIYTEDQRQRMSEVNNQFWKSDKSLETKKRMSSHMKELRKNGHYDHIGELIVKKRRENGPWHSEETKEKIRKTKRINKYKNSLRQLGSII